MSDSLPLIAVFEGMWRYARGRAGRPKVPRHDPSKPPIVFQPHFRVMTWRGSADIHRTEKCGEPPKCSNPGIDGEHSETVPDGFTWEGVRFHGLFGALENQAFRQWYEAGGQQILERGDLVLRAPQYREDDLPPLPRFNFFLHENLGKMTPQEIIAYRQTGEVPKRLRRRGRNKPKEAPLEE